MMGMTKGSSHRFDFIVVGSGFGGSVTAMRLAQKGYSVAILEKGNRFGKEDFAKTNWNLRRYLWAPMLKCFGIQEISFLKGVMVLHGAGVGGGSLVYANTLMEPHPDVFLKNSWPNEIDWFNELRTPFLRAKKMLGVTENPHESLAEEALLELSKKLSCENSFHKTDVGVFFNSNDEEVSDPYFQGQGPRRQGCNLCGGCMVGCRFNAKNTLDKNYLYFAEKWGAKIYPSQSVQKITPHNSGGYELVTKNPHHLIFQEQTRFYAKNVILAAGVLGTLEILFKNKIEYKTLVNISDQLGAGVRTNGESLCGATSFDSTKDLSRGLAIGSAIHPSPGVKIEPVRYSKGSDLLRFIAVPLTGPGGRWLRPLKLASKLLTELPNLIRLLKVKDWAQQTMILLVMQTTDETLHLRWLRSWRRLFRKGLDVRDQESQVPSYLPIAQEASTQLAEIIHGMPQNVISEVLAGTPATAHILGGCLMSTSTKDGVLNSRQEVLGYPGLYVMDGSVVASNLGVNPSLTISALAERFSEQFPSKILNP